MILCLLLLASQFDPKFSPKFAEASRLLEKQDYSTAARLLEELTQEKPEVGDYWHALGMAKAASGDLPASLAPLERACKADFKPARACYQWGKILQSLGKHAEAVAAISAGPRGGTDAQSLSARAVSLEVLGEFKGADNDYRAALAESALRPKNSAEVQLRYAQFLMRQGQFEAALWQFQQLLRKQPFMGLAWRDRGVALLQLNRLEEAVDALEQAIAHGERKKENLMLLSQIYGRLGNPEKAESYRREANPD